MYSFFFYEGSFMKENKLAELSMEFSKLLSDCLICIGKEKLKMISYN